MPDIGGEAQYSGELVQSTASAAEKMELIVGSLGDVVSVWNEIQNRFKSVLSITSYIATSFGDDGCGLQ